MKTETRKARLRRLSYLVAEGIKHAEDAKDCNPTPVTDLLSAAYERGYKQAMSDLRRELADVPQSSADDALDEHRTTVQKFLGGVR